MRHVQSPLHVDTRGHHDGAVAVVSLEHEAQKSHHFEVDLHDAPSADLVGLEDSAQHTADGVGFVGSAADLDDGARGQRFGKLGFVDGQLGDEGFRQVLVGVDLCEGAVRGVV